MEITSSAVMTPVSEPFSSTTGSVRRLYLSKISATSRSSASGEQEMSGSAAKLGEARVGVGDDEFGERDGAEKLLILADEEDGAHALQAAIEVLQHLDRVMNAGRGGERHVIGGHAPGGGVFFKFEKLFDLLALFGLHLLENGVGALFGEVAKKVGGGVGIHLLDDVGGAIGLHGIEDGDLELGIDLLQSLGGDIFIQGLEDGIALGGREFFDDVGDVGGMETGDTLGGNLEADAAGRDRSR